VYLRIITCAEENESIGSFFVKMRECGNILFLETTFFFITLVAFPRKSAYILREHLYFEKVPIFCECANILGKRQYFDNFCLRILLDFVAANICEYFQYFFMHFCVRQYFWRNCFEA
jgi:hypothetical protein